ncbi:MAG: hypothetical protein ACI82O_004289 [Patiriisocius sp.]|jgi:hypothetical protein
MDSQSHELIDDACTLTSTSSTFCTGFGASLSCNSSGIPYLANTIALNGLYQRCNIFILPELDQVSVQSVDAADRCAASVSRARVHSRAELRCHEPRFRCSQVRRGRLADVLQTDHRETGHRCVEHHDTSEISFS